jgi:hypothetical protein
VVEFLTNRELALIVSVLFWSAVLALRSRRGNSGDGLGNPVRGLLSAIADKWILAPVGVYLCWMAAALAAANAVGLWDAQLVKAAALWWLLSGLGLFGAGLEAIKRKGAIVGALKRLVGVALVFEFVASAASFSLFVEIPLQILAVPCMTIWGFASVRREHRRAGELAYGYLALLGFAALGWGIARLVADWEDIDHDLWWRELVMPFWLAPAALAFMSLLALYLASKATFSVMGSQSAVGLSWRHRLAVLARCGPRLRAIRAVRSAAPWLANDPGFRSTWRWVGRVLGEDRDKRADEAAQAQRLVDNAGVVGTDPAGRQLDQREHAETMEALRSLYFCQLGHYPRQGNRYSAGLEAVIDSLSDMYDLPRPNDIEMRISDDGQHWYAARQTITGHWFAIGAAGPPTDQWFYDSPTAPNCFPNESEWDQWLPDSNSPNWAETPNSQPASTTEEHETGHLHTSSAAAPLIRTTTGRMMARTKTRESARPTWCRHYDEWKRAYDEPEALMTRNSDRTEDWSPEDLTQLAELTRAYGQAAGRMWDEAPESENWNSAHIKCR